MTLFLVKGTGGDNEYVTCPAAISHGATAEDQVTPEMAVKDAFRSAVLLANKIKAPLVVVDPDCLWQTEWGLLYREGDET